MKLHTLILADNDGTDFGVLTEYENAALLRFSGSYRFIDFLLSNCVNSRLFDILFVPQFLSGEVVNHIGNGSSWDLNRHYLGGLRFLRPKVSSKSSGSIGTAQILYENWSLVREGRPSHILILTGNSIYRMDYNKLIEYHLREGADVSIVTDNPGSQNGSTRLGIERLSNIGVYLFNFDTLDSEFREIPSSVTSSQALLRILTAKMIQNNRIVVAYPYKGYAFDISSIDAYWLLHMKLVASIEAIDFFDPSWIIRTNNETRSAALFQKGADIRNSFVSRGSIVANATLESSVLSPGVYIGPNAVVRESILGTDVYIEAGAVVERAIVDKNCVIGYETRVGSINQSKTGKSEITVIGRNSHVPNGFLVPSGAVVGRDKQPNDFTSSTWKV